MILLYPAKRGLSKGQFLTLLEQYLIIKLMPTVNRKLLFTPDIL